MAGLPAARSVLADQPALASDRGRGLIWKYSSPLVAAVACLVIAVLALALLGYPPGQVLGIVWHKVIWRGDAARRLNSWSNILQYSTPILLTGLAIVVAFRASVWNIGAQGQFLVGAVAANACAALVSAPGILLVPMVLTSAMLAGALLAVIAGTLERLRGVPVVLSTLLLNFVAIELMRYAILGPLRDDGPLVRTISLSATAQLATVAGTSLHVGFFIALVTAVAVGWVLKFSTFGFRLQAVGENATAARFAGMVVGRISLLTLALSGALAGLAGGVELAGVRHELVLSDAESTFGFTGIAVALLARLSPVGVIASAIFFGMLRACFLTLEAEARVPSVTAEALQGMTVILMLALTQPWPVQLRGLFRRGRGSKENSQL